MKKSISAAIFIVSLFSSSFAFVSAEVALPTFEQQNVIDIIIGDGPTAQMGSTVRVVYTMKLVNGAVVDSSEKYGNLPFEFTIGGQEVLPAFQKAALGMKVRGERQVTITPDLGFKIDIRDAAGNIIIPKDSTLVLKIKLLAIMYNNYELQFELSDPRQVQLNNNVEAALKLLGVKDPKNPPKPQNNLQQLTQLQNPTPCLLLTQTLRKGSRDGNTKGEVSRLQKFLAEKYSLDSSTLISGVFGNTTATYVMKFQKENKLPATGLVGPLTIKVINKTCALEAKRENSAAAIDTSYLNTSPLIRNPTLDNLVVLPFGNSDIQLKNELAKIRKFMPLPQDEMPLRAEIVDAETLTKEQPFYKGAQNGDVLIMYSKARIAIIYSPSRDILVNAGPIKSNY